MKTSNALLFILVLVYINASTEWPTHTVCKEDNLEIHYKSCGEIFYISIFLLAAQQSCSYAVSKAYKPRSEWKGYTPKPALGFTSKIFLVFQVQLVLVHIHAQI